jgi:hypothetical protein
MTVNLRLEPIEQQRVRLALPIGLGTKQALHEKTLLLGAQI